MSKRHTPLLLSLLLVVATLLAYWPGMSGGFLLDDYPNIVTNPLVQPADFNLDTMMRAAQSYDAGGYGRPLATVSFALDYLVHGKQPWGYKLTGLLVHTLNALLIFWLVARLLQFTWDRSRTCLVAAFCVSMLWAAHPLQVSSALYIVQRMETLSLTFVVLGLISYLHGRQRQLAAKRGWPWLAGAGGLMVLGLSSKEPAALLPAYTLALELTIFRFGAALARTARFLKWSYASGVTAPTLLFVFVILAHYSAAQVFINRGFTAYERRRAQFRGLPMDRGPVLPPLPASLKFY